MSESIQSGVATRKTRSGTLRQSPKTDRETLEILAQHAFASHPAPADTEKRVEFVWRHVEGEINLLVELFKPHRDAIISSLLRDVLRKQQDEARPTVSGSGRAQMAKRPAGRPPTTRPDLTGTGDALRRSMLDDFKINGQSIGDVTVQEAREWMEARDRDNRFVELLISGLPEDGSLIRKHRKPAEANALYRRAEDGK